MTSFKITLSDVQYDDLSSSDSCLGANASAHQHPSVLIAMRLDPSHRMLIKATELWGIGRGVSSMGHGGYAMLLGGPRGLFGN